MLLVSLCSLRDGLHVFKRVNQVNRHIDQRTLGIISHTM